MNDKRRLQSGTSFSSIQGKQASKDTARPIGSVDDLSRLQPGEVGFYHRGFLAIRRSGVLHDIANAAMRLAEEDRVHLVQRLIERDPDAGTNTYPRSYVGTYDYFVIGARRSNGPPRKRPVSARRSYRHTN